MNIKRAVGLSFVIVSMVLSMSNLSLTGNVIGNQIKTPIGISGFIIFIIGVLLIIGSDQNYPGSKLNKLSQEADELLTKAGFTIYNQKKEQINPSKTRKS